MGDSAFYSLATFAIAAWLFKSWLGDLFYFSKNGKPRKGAFPAAKPASGAVVALGAVAGALWLAVVSGTEILAGDVAAQSKVGCFALLSWFGASFIEELIFRGYLGNLILGRGKIFLWGGVFVFSALFALAHPFLWDYAVPENGSVSDAAFSINLTAKAARDTLFVFFTSVLFYALRFCPANKLRSLAPCIAAHFVYNAGVFCVKAAQGFVSWTF